MENAQSIFNLCQLPCNQRDRAVTYLCWCVLVRKQDSQNCCTSNEVFHLERVNVWIVGRAVVIKHEVDDISGGANEDNLENRVVQIVDAQRGPKQIWGRRQHSRITIERDFSHTEISRYVDNEVEKLAFERDTGCCLQAQLVVL